MLSLRHYDKAWTPRYSSKDIYCLSVMPIAVTLRSGTGDTQIEIRHQPTNESQIFVPLTSLPGSDPEPKPC